MTETKWLTCTKPADLLAEISNHQPTHRKCRLLLCGYCRRFHWQVMPSPYRAAIEASERYADGASKYQLQKAIRGLSSVSRRPAQSAWEAICAANWAISASDPYSLARQLFRAPLRMPGVSVREGRASGPKRGQRRVVAELVRDVFGNPFRPAALNPIWLTWNNAAATKIAQGIYDERRFGDLPILADALEEAGCTDADILKHCRQPSEHLRGCWVVDLLLGKK